MYGNKSKRESCSGCSRNDEWMTTDSMYKVDDKYYCFRCKDNKGVSKMSCDQCKIEKDSLFMHKYADGTKLCSLCRSDKDYEKLKRSLGMSDWSGVSGRKISSCKFCQKGSAVAGGKYDGYCGSCRSDFYKMEFAKKNEFCKCGRKQQVSGTFAFCEHCAKTKNALKTICSKCRKETKLGGGGECKCLSETIREINKPSNDEYYLRKSIREAESMVSDKFRMDDWRSKERNMNYYVHNHRNSNYPTCPYCQAQVGLDTWISQEFNISGDMNLEVEKEKWKHVRNCSEATDSQKKEATHQLTTIKREVCKKCKKNGLLFHSLVSSETADCFDCLLENFSNFQKEVQRLKKEGKVFTIRAVWNDNANRSFRQALLREAEKNDQESFQKFKQKFDELQEDMDQRLDVPSHSSSIGNNNNNNSFKNLLIGGVILLSILTLGGIIWRKFKKKTILKKSVKLSNPIQLEDLPNNNNEIESIKITTSPSYFSCLQCRLVYKVDVRAKNGNCKWCN